MKQKQHHPKTRAPHYDPEFTKRITFRCTPEMKKEFDRKGGSEWGRITLSKAMRLK